MNNTQLFLPPAQLWIGTSTHLTEQVITFLQSLWCPRGGCTTCTICHGIQGQQHHALLWITPAPGYTRELIEPILQTIRLERSEPEPFFFVLNNADFLTPACANMLLKSIEEPPAGYHFLLLAQRAEWVIATIRSRCIITHKHTAVLEQHAHPNLFNQFVKPTTPADFLAILEQSKITERESLELLDALLVFYTKAYHTTTASGDTIGCLSTTTILTLIQKAMRTPPATGSSKLFWKNLFFQITTL